MKDAGTVDLRADDANTSTELRLFCKYNKNYPTGMEAYSDKIPIAHDPVHQDPVTRGHAHPAFRQEMH